VLRLAAATARAQLLGAASLVWKQPANELKVKDGVISHPSGASAHYGELAKVAASTPSGTVQLKPASEWKLIGSAAPRLDVVAKSNGTAQFGMDVRPPGLLFAAIRHCPMIGGSVGAVDVAATLKLPGVERVVRLGSYAGSTEALAVVARSGWHAQQGAAALAVQWRSARPAASTAPPSSPSSSGAPATRMRATAASPSTRSARCRQPMPARARERDAGLSRPLPGACGARADQLHRPGGRRQGRGLGADAGAGPGPRIAAEVAGVAPESVTVHVTYLGGGFGRRLDVDFVGQAVRIAIECGGRPVQLVWSREEDLGHDFYRPAGVAVLRATLGEDGRPSSLRITSAGDAITPRWLERGLPHWPDRSTRPTRPRAKACSTRSTRFPTSASPTSPTQSGVPVGYWRSVGHSHNAFFSESFIDELAHAAGQDPVAYRWRC
jgi:isoquinoline 1-oxidoreductase beta subunit